jgi:hypothetical protein
MPHVFFNFQGNAVAAVLAFVGLGVLEVVAVLAAIVLFSRRMRRAARAVLVGAVAVAAVYGDVLLLFSVASRDQVAAPGEEKYFCEVDCHLAYSVIGVRESKALGTGVGRTVARGRYSVVELRVRFDEKTIGPLRPADRSLTPNPRAVAVVDAAGNAYVPDPAGQRAFELVQGPTIPLTRPLLPGESYVTRLVFDLPEGVREPRLLLRESDWITLLLIGHENSPLHRKTSFRLG